MSTQWLCMLCQVYFSYYVFMGQSSTYLLITNFSSDLPNSNALHLDSKWSLKRVAEFEGVTTDLNQVVQQSTHPSQWKGRREESDVAKLDEHFQVVLKGVIIL